jgi:hypothetical protein
MIEDQQQRFLFELEFVNSLANLAFVNCEYSSRQLLIDNNRFDRTPSGLIHSYACAGLAQSRLFEDQAFVQYLKYLQYWMRPEYSRYIMWVLARCPLAHDMKYDMLSS